jgi:hypothetical protein
MNEKITLVLPERVGERPRTDGPYPHSQVSDQGPVELGHEIVERVRALPGITIGETLISVEGATAFHVSKELAVGPPEAFAKGTEFGHLHPSYDTSFHVSARPETVKTVVNGGWGEPLPKAPNTLLLYAPRDADEVEIVWTIVLDTYHYATGR